MKLLFKKLSVIFVALIVVDIAFGWIYKRMAENLPHNEETLYHPFVDDCNADIILMGASRAQHGYIPSIFCDSLNMKCVNVAGDGLDILHTRTLFKCITKKHIPKIVVIDLADRLLDGSCHGQLTGMEYYYGIIPEIRETMDAVYSDIEKLKRKSNLYNGNKSIIKFLIAYLKGELASDGYIPRCGNNYKGVFGEYKEKNSFVVEPLSETYLQEISSFCHENNIKLVVVNSPCMIEYDGTYDKYMSGFCGENNVLFLNHGCDTNFIHNSDLFYDIQHLNHEGADKFSRILASELKRMY